MSRVAKTPDLHSGNHRGFESHLPYFMKQTKYRIKEYTNKDGKKYFRVQERWLLIWVTLKYSSNHFDSTKDAQSEIDRLRQLDILRDLTGS